MNLNVTQNLFKLFILVIAMTCSLSSAFAQPANNECSGAMNIGSLFGQTAGAAQTSMTFDNTNATTEASDPATGWECFGEPDGGNTAPSLENTLWFTFNGDGGFYYMTTVACNATNYLAAGDTQIAIYEGSCGALVPVECNEDGPDSTNDEFPAGLNLQTVAGTTYYVMIDGFNFNGSVSAGEYCIQVTQQMQETCTTSAGLEVEGSSGVATGGDFVCFGDATSFELSGVIVPTVAEAGFFWAVSSADISGSNDPAAEESFLGAFSTSATPYLAALVNDGSQLPAGTYYFTAISYGGAAVDSMGTLDLANACVFTANSVGVTLVEDVDELTVTPSSVGNTGANDGEASVAVTGGSGAYNFNWGNGETTATITNLAGGNYTVTVSDVTGCAADVVETITVAGSTSTDELRDLASIELFPNPAYEFATINYNFTQNLDLNIVIMDILGRTIIEQNEGNVQNGSVTINLKDLTKGIYLVQFTNGEEKFTRKLFVDRP